MDYTLEEIGHIVNGRVGGQTHLRVNNISLDSRTLHDTHGTIFAAIRGERHDAHRFLPDLVGRGVKAFLVEEWPEECAGSPTGHIMVDDTLKALQRWAAHHREQSRASVIGVTGSNGKTIVKEWLYQVLSPEQRVIRSPRSYNSQVGVPLSVLHLREDTEMAVFEAGISQRGEMERLEPMIRPDIGIFTNIGPAHQEHFAGTKEKISEKLLLFKQSRVLIYRSEHEEIRRLARQAYPEKTHFTWSLEGDADLRIVPALESRGTRIVIEGKERRLEVMLPMRDLASLENAIHVIAVMIWLDMPDLVIASRIADLVPVAMRLEMVKGINQCTLINDSYNSDLNSLSIALDYLHQQQQPVRTLILSDMDESGMDADMMHAAIARLLKSKKLDRFFGIGSTLSDLPARHGNSGGFPEDSRFYPDTTAFLETLDQLEFNQEAILVKGSRRFQFERIIRRLEEKSHRTYMEVDLAAMVHNLNVYRSRTPAMIMVMVKAFSYGSGAVEIARVLQHEQVDYLCVAYPDEGVQLRKAGIHLPVMVMNPEITDYESMLEYDLEPEIYHFRGLFHFLDMLGRRNLPSFPVHIKLETGMNRLGFRQEELAQLFGVLDRHPELRIRSVFTHLGTADEPGHDRHTRQQIALFEQMSRAFLQRSEHPVLRHVLNSAGIERFPEAAYDMVRLGIGLYGISPTLNNELQTVSSMKSIVSQLKPVKRGEPVGYGRHYIARDDMQIAVVPVGYADGLSRNLGDHGVGFRISGKEAKVLGHLCMDMCMLDVTGLGLAEGDPVEIFGRGQSVSELAERLGTIPYEILAGISQRVKRVYVRE